MYWLTSLPLLESEERTWTLLQNKTTYENDYSINFRFAIPELRVGTLDSLMVLSDDLVKVNALVESVVNKLRRQLFDMGSAARGDDFQEVSLVAAKQQAIHGGPGLAGWRCWLAYCQHVHFNLPPHAQVSVEGVSPDQYLERFAWNEAKYPPRRPLAETVSAITETTQKLEDDLKVTSRPAHV